MVAPECVAKILFHVAPMSIIGAKLFEMGLLIAMARLLDIDEPIVCVDKVRKTKLARRSSFVLGFCFRECARPELEGFQYVDL